MTEKLSPAAQIMADISDDTEIGFLLSAGWLHDGDDNWFPPCEENLTSFTRADAIRAQQLIDSGMIVSRDNLHRMPR